jgi:hypothetical protein
VQGIWAILSLIYLLVAPSVLAGFHNVYIICNVQNIPKTDVLVVLEFLNMIFFFAGFIAVAAAIGTFNCDLLDDEFGFGSDLKTGCQTTKAATAFGAFSW